jgi:hypothetical protein
VKFYLDKRRPYRGIGAFNCLFYNSAAKAESGLYPNLLIGKEDAAMQARGPLMIEHRLIERMLLVVKDVVAKIEAQHEVDPVFVDTAVDFIRMYADRTHHGKEEDILFRQLKNKPMSDEDLRIMK